MEEKAFFTGEELLQIYAEAKTTELSRLQDAARKLFPDALELADVLYIREDGGRAFPDAEGKYSRPAFTFGGPMLREIGIMEDGSAHIY